MVKMPKEKETTIITSSRFLPVVERTDAARKTRMPSRHGLKPATRPAPKNGRDGVNGYLLQIQARAIGCDTQVLLCALIAWQCESSGKIGGLVGQGAFDEAFQQGIVSLIIPIVDHLHSDYDGRNILGPILLDDTMPLLRIIVVPSDIERHIPPDLLDSSLCRRAFRASRGLD